MLDWAYDSAKCAACIILAPMFMKFCSFSSYCVILHYFFNCFSHCCRPNSHHIYCVDRMN